MWGLQNLFVDAGSIPVQATHHNSSNQCQFPYVETGTSFTGLPLRIIATATETQLNKENHHG